MNREFRPLVSIITPSLNQARFLDDTLRSVRDQTYPHIEHIVIDGGSTDGTVEMLARNLCDERFRWLSEPDDGMYWAVNKGLRMASGSIVAYLNADDVFLPWSVAAAVDFLRISAGRGPCLRRRREYRRSDGRGASPKSSHRFAPLGCWRRVVNPTTCHLLASGCAQQDRIIR